MILPVVLYGYETWSLILRQDHTHRLRVFENRVRRRIIRRMREEAAGGWRRLRNEELYNMYNWPNIVRVIKSRNMRWVRNVARMGAMRNAYNILVGKPERKRPLGKPRRRWEYNIRIDLREIGLEGVDWMHLVQYTDQWRPLLSTVMNLRLP